MAQWYEFRTIHGVGMARANDAETAKAIAARNGYGGIEPAAPDPGLAGFLEQLRQGSPDKNWATSGLGPRDRRQVNSDDEHTAAMIRADALMGCTEGSDEESELKNIVDAIEAYERVRWPEGEEPGGKG